MRLQYAKGDEMNEYRLTKLEQDVQQIKSSLWKIDQLFSDVNLLSSAINLTQCRISRVQSEAQNEIENLREDLKQKGIL